MVPRARIRCNLHRVQKCSGGIPRSPQIRRICRNGQECFTHVALNGRRLGTLNLYSAENLCQRQSRRHEKLDESAKLSELPPGIATGRQSHSCPQKRSIAQRERTRHVTSVRAACWSPLEVLNTEWENSCAAFLEGAALSLGTSSGDLCVEPHRSGIKELIANWVRTLDSLKVPLLLKPYEPISSRRVFDAKPVRELGGGHSAARLEYQL
jgi:hypothetical protein